MTEYNEIFELVLYYNRRAVVKPHELKFEDIQQDNLNMSVDEQLDLYSKNKEQYKEDLIQYEMVKNDSIVSDYVRITEDEKFIENVKNFEKNDFFIKWNKSSKKLIDVTFVKLLK